VAARLATSSDGHSIERVTATFRLMLKEAGGAGEDLPEFGKPDF